MNRRAWSDRAKRGNMSDADQRDTRGVRQESGATPAPAVSSLLETAGALGARASEPASTAQAISALEQAFELDPIDRTGAISTLLGRLYFLQERYGDAVRHLEAAVLKRPGDTELAGVLERAARNCQTRIDRPMSVVEYTDAVKLTTPPALYLRAPEIRAPLPVARQHPWRHSAPVLALQTVAGAGLGIVLKAAIAATRRAGLNDETRPAWIRRSRIPALLTLAAYREWLNGNVIQDPYRHGDLTADQPAGQKRPAWTRTMPTANGSWRTDDPMEGAALARYAQQGAQPIERYQSRLADPRLPNPREVARAFLHQKPGTEQTLAPFLNKLYIAWIQFQSHDWFSHGENVAGTGLYRIPLAPDDPIRLKHGLEALEIKRTQPDPHPSGGLLTYPNEVTHWWDGSQIYGSNQETEDRVRTGPEGKLLADGRLYLPQNLLPVSPTTGIEESGFTRNWWLGLSMFHTLFARHHNRICEGLKGAYPDHPWTSDQLFKVARLINAAVMAKIHTVEWTPAVLPNRKVAQGLWVNWWGLPETRLRRYKNRRIQRVAKLRHPILGGLVGGKRDNHGVRHQFSEEFVSAYRLHEGLTEQIGIRYIGDPDVRTAISTDATRGHAAHRLVQAHGLGNLFNSFGLEKGGALVNNNLPKWMTDMSVDGHAVIDIGTIDILRDRERGVPGYNDLRALQGLPRLKTYDDLAVDPETKANLERLYGPAPQGLEIMDLQVGMLCDRRRPEGFGFDDLRFAFFIKAASSRLEEDPMFCENVRPEVYTEWGLDHIDAMDLRGVLLLECPELAGSPLARKNGGRYTIGNAFEPWGTTAETHPDEHPLTAKHIERY